MNRHHAKLAGELESIAAQLDIADLRDIEKARITDSQLVAAVKQDDFPGLDIDSVVIEDITITPGSSGARTPRARVYRPRGVSRRLPALMFLHGGAFCLGDLETDHLRCVLYAQETGSVVINVDYALAPEFPYPAGLDDVLTACRWARSAAGDLNIDPRRICIGGESAGACLAAAVALQCRDFADIEMCGQMLLFPATDHRLLTPSMRDGDDMPAWNTKQCRLMWAHYLGDPGRTVSCYAAPALAVDLAGLPPALVVTAEIDPLRDEGLDYGRMLCAAGVSTEIHNYPGTFHVFDVAAPALPIAQRALGEQIDFVRRVTAG